ncbi:MAG TPA: hypothetical protein VHM29_12235 [Acidimicrobiia bacterium]|nr:hypothetical protein [Acidimicrobiia bacterium]
MLGLIGGPLIIISGIAVLYDLIEAGGSVQALIPIPEFFLGVVARCLPRRQGFRPSPILEDPPRVIRDPSVGVS